MPAFFFLATVSGAVGIGRRVMVSTLPNVQKPLGRGCVRYSTTRL